MFQSNQQVGPYTLLRMLGRGGFGEVWLAEKRSSLLPRQVALKLPLDPDPDLMAVQQEAQTWLQAGHHPNVLPVIDAEVFEGQVAIASEYASGGSLKDWLKQTGGKAPTVEAAVTMATGMLAGLQHLHSLKPQPIIHRDLKPDNVLLQDGVPRLTDFGISRVLKSSRQTHSSSGTPSYMPPEAFDGRYSVQSDIWAMGVVLYQMLTGRLPFPQPDLASLYGAIKQRPYDPLPTTIPKAVQTIVARALAKDPAQRFGSAAAMSAALAAIPAASQGDTLDDNVLPKPKPTPLPQPTFSWSSLVVPGIIIGLVVYARTRPTPIKKPDIKPSPSVLVNPTTLTTPISNPLNLNRPFSTGGLKLNSFPRLTAGAATSVWSHVIPMQTGQALAWSPSGQYLVTSGDQNTAIIWNAATGLSEKVLTGHRSLVTGVAWSPDGRYIATYSSGGTVIAWEAATGQLLNYRFVPTGASRALAWSPDSRYVALAAANNAAVIWNPVTGKDVLTLTGHLSPVCAAAWSPDGGSVVTTSTGGTAIVWSALLGLKRSTHPVAMTGATAVAWSPDSKSLVTPGEKFTASIWDASTGTDSRILSGHFSSLSTVAWSPDGKSIAAISSGGNTIVWGAADGLKLCSHSVPTASVSALAWSPDSRYLATAGDSQTAVVWDSTTGLDTRTMSEHLSASATAAASPVQTVIWSPDGSYLATAGGGGSASVWKDVK